MGYLKRSIRHYYWDNMRENVHLYAVKDLIIQILVMFSSPIRFFSFHLIVNLDNNESKYLHYSIYSFRKKFKITNNKKSHILTDRICNDKWEEFNNKFPRLSLAKRE